MSDEKKNAAYWLKTIQRRQKVLSKEWIKDARRIVELYDGAKEGMRFNILYSNTETLLPALYNSVPRPEVSRRYTARDAAERQQDGAIAQVGERTLEYLCDTNDEGYETFDDAVQSAVFDSLVPGQGQVRVRYKSKDGYQALCWEHLPYDRFLWAFARKWEHVPWVAFGHDLTREGFEKFFPEFIKTEKYRQIDWEEREESQEGETEGEKQYGSTVLVWEVHIAATKEIKYVCELASDQFLLEEPYPCDLSSRFPCPKPLAFVKKTADLIPRPLYTLYEHLAEDLNDTTRRLARVVQAIRVRGVYNSQIAEFEKVLSADDNQLIPSENANVLFTEKGGLAANIWLLPIEDLVKVAQQLYVAQGNIKQTIFEMMGIADIQRGSTAAGETAAAQTIKDKWSGVRLKRNQREVAKFCRSLLRIGLEMAGELFTPATLRSITRMPFLMDSEVEARMQQMMLQAQQNGERFQPPAQRPVTWEQISRLLKDQLQRTYRIDLETNSTIDIEATEDKESIAEFMNAFGQMMAGFKPMLEQQALDPELMKEVLLEVTKRFRFGRRIETVIEQMQPPQPQQGQDPKPQLEKMAAEHAKAQAQLQGQLLTAMSTVQQLKIEISELQARITLEQIGGKLRENQVTAEMGDKLRQKDLQMADKAIDTRFKMAAGELKRMQEGISRELKGATGQLQEAKVADPVLREGIQQQLQAFGQIVETQQALLGAIQQLGQLIATPKYKELVEDEQGRVIGVKEMPMPTEQLQ